MLGFFELYYPIIMSFIWIIGSIFFNYCNKTITKNNYPIQLDEPSVDIFMACYNEESVLEDSINSLEKIDYSNYQIILIDDKSTDNTLKIMKKLAKKYTNITVETQEKNTGKATALNKALKKNNAEYILCVDADTFFEKKSLNYLVKSISVDNKIAAVTGRPIVKNTNTLIGKLQFLEYIMNIDMIKRAQSFFLGHILTVSGVMTIFRKEALEKVGGWSPTAMTEDIDITWRLYDKGYYCTYQPLSLCKIYVPETIKGFIKQRIRWGRGGLEVLKKHFFNIPILSFGQRILAVDMCFSYLWVFVVSFAICKLFFKFAFLKNLDINLGTLVSYYIVTLIFYGCSKIFNFKSQYIIYRDYWLYVPFFFYAYWLNNIIVIFATFYHFFDTVQYAAWGDSDRGKNI